MRFGQPAQARLWHRGRAADWLTSPPTVAGRRPSVQTWPRPEGVNRGHPPSDCRRRRLNLFYPEAGSAAALMLPLRGLLLASYNFRDSFHCLPTASPPDRSRRAGFGKSAQPPREASSTFRQTGEDDDRLSRHAIYAINLLLVAVASMIPPYGRTRLRWHHCRCFI